MKHIRALVLGILLFVFVGTAAFIYSKRPKDNLDHCIDTFSDFAYKWPENDDSIIQEGRLSDPWVMESEFPDLSEIPIWFRDYKVEIIQDFPDRSEIWLTSFGNRFNSFDERTAYRYLVFETTTRNWKFIPATTTHAGKSYVGRLFIDTNGNLWGQNFFDASTKPQPNIPILSKYNSNREHFESVPETDGIPVMQINGISAIWTKTILDNNDIFWFFVSGDGVYTYDIELQTITREVDLSIGELDLDNVLITADNNFYITTSTVT